MARKLVSKEKFDRIAGASRVRVMIAYKAWNKPTRAQVTSALDRTLTGQYTLGHSPNTETYEVEVASSEDLGGITSLSSWGSSGSVDWAELRAHVKGE